MKLNYYNITQKQAILIRERLDSEYNSEQKRLSEINALMAYLHTAKSNHHLSEKQWRELLNEQIKLTDRMLDLDDLFSSLKNQ